MKEREDLELRSRPVAAEISDKGWSAMKEDVAEVAAAAKEQGRHFVDAAWEQAKLYADHRKDNFSDSVSDFARSLQGSTSSFEDRPHIQAVVDGAAKGLEQIARGIRQRSMSDILSEAGKVVKARPGTVAGIGLALGFIAARLMKSTAESVDRSQEK